MHYHVTPIYGESIFSLISRAHVLTGNGSPLATLKTITGCRGYKPLSGLPTRLDNIAKTLGVNGGPTRLIRAHTHFPLYAHFLTSERKQLLIDAMLADGAPKARLGLLRSDVGAKEFRRYCLKCQRADIERHGVAIWRRQHCLPGITVCSEHNTALSELSGSTRFHDRQLGLPGIGDPARPPLDPDAHDRIKFLADQVKSALETQATTLISGPVYRCLLKEVGLQTKNGRIRQRHLSNLVQEWLHPLSALPVFERLLRNLRTERSWVAELTDSDNGFHHPLKHMVLWGALALDFSAVRNAAGAFGEQLTLDLDNRRTLKLTRDLLVEVLQETGSCRKAAQCLGLDVTTLLTAMDMHDIPVKKRPKAISESKRAAIASVPASIPTALVAEQHGVSVSTVNRIRRVKRAQAQSEEPVMGISL